MHSSPDLNAVYAGKLSCLARRLICMRRIWLINPVPFTSSSLPLALALIVCIAVTTQPAVLLAQPIEAFKPLSDSSKLHEVKLHEVKWAADSFWGERQRACREGTLPTMTLLMEGKDRSHFVENFRIAAGLSKGKHRGPGWNDGDTYKWIEALAATFAQTRAPQLLETMNAAIEAICLAQRPDGYLHTPVLIAARNGDTTARPFGDPINFEMYNFGHLMTAACVHFEATGDRKLLDAAIRVADFLDREFSRPDAELARHAVCPAHYMGIVDLYRLTRNDRYLELTKRLLRMRNLVQGGDDNQDRIPLHEQREAVGHAVRANYLYAGAADLVLETGDRDLLQALDSCWTSVHDKKIYITGGCGALYDGASPDGSSEQKQITRVHQAYGRNYQLPNSTAHNETCAAIGFVLWSHRMWRLTDDSKYIDALENALLNAVLAGVSLDGQRFFYTNTLRQLDAMPTELRWSRDRKSWISCYCCPPNVARTIASVQRYAYAVNEQSTTVLLYGSNSVDTQLPSGQSLKLTQRSGYPTDGRIEITVHAAPQSEYTLRFRIPSWCSNAKLKMNGTEQPIASRSQNAAQPAYASLSRRWSSGDRVELELEMPTQLISAHPLVEECRGQVAVRRGPLVYCAESIDLQAAATDATAGHAPQSPRIETLGLTNDATWEVQPNLGDWRFVPTLTGTVAINQAKQESQELYRPYSPPQFRSVQSQLIPYFAWGNRGATEMSVWLPMVDSR